MRSEPRVAEKAGEIQEARVAMERMTREIRQGDSVVSATGTQFSLITNVNSATCGGANSTEARLCRVTYACSGGSLHASRGRTRTAAAPSRP